jgi:hypothetical protein
MRSTPLAVPVLMTVQVSFANHCTIYACGRLHFSDVPVMCPGALLTFLFEMTPGGDNEVQRTMLEIVNQLDGFDSRGNIKVHTAFTPNLHPSVQSLAQSNPALLSISCMRRHAC